MSKKQTFDLSTGDSFTNFLAKLGANTQNLQSYSQYSLSPFVTRNRIDLEAAYRSSWLVGQVVDTVAEDMTREGVTINSKLPPEDVKLIQSTFTDLNIWHEISNTIKWARLYGGAIAVILTEGADYEKPLNINAVGKGRFKGLVVFDRWMLDPSFGDLVTEIGPSMGKPKYYRILPGMPALSGVKVHYSRVIRFDGIELPYYQRLTENLWGLSVVERMYDRLVAFDSATQGASQLLHKAHLRTIRVKGFREALALGGATESAVVKQFNYIRLLQTLEGMTVLDGDDQFEIHPYSFGGISDVLMQFGEQISGATGIPLVRLFGQSPAGLSSTGESDLRNYYDHINKLQESQMRAPLVKLFDVIGRSVLGKALPKDFEFEFNSLWQLSDTEKGQIAATDATTIASAYGAGLITKKIGMKELLQSSRVSGRFTNITEEDIESAKEEVPAGEENPFASPPEGSESSGSPLPPSDEDNEKTIEDLKNDLEALNVEGGDDDSLDALKKKLDEIDVDREIVDKPSAADGSVKRFFKDGIGKILKPLVGLALVYRWLKKDKQISTEERVNRLLGRSPYSPGSDSAVKPSKKEILESIQKELKNIRSTFDAHLRAPKGGVTIKGKEFKGGEFIPSKGGYVEEYEKMKKEGKSGSSEEPKEENKTGISTESPEFKAWFKGSKVVNENGDPLVVYHGTSKEFSEFSKEKIGSNLDTGDWGKGFYFGDKPKAEEYGKRSANPEAWKTKPFYIDIKNPLALSGSRKEEILTPDHPWTSVLKKMFGKEIIDRAIEDELDIPSLIRGEIGSDKFTETLKENGYDGVIRKYKEDSYEIIPFDPEQIKSVEKEPKKKEPEEKKKRETGRKDKTDHTESIDNIRRLRPVFNKVLQNPEQNKANVVKSLTEKTKVDYDTVNQFIHTWAKTSADHNPRSLAIQFLVKDMFNLKNSSTQHFELGKDEVLSKTSKQVSDYKKMIKTVYEDTQKWFKDNGYSPEDKMLLYRGTKSKISDSDTYALQPLSSFSTSKNTAKNFAGEKGSVFGVQVLVKNMFSIPVTGVGCSSEAEVVVFGDKVNISIFKEIEITEQKKGNLKSVDFGKNLQFIDVYAEHANLTSLEGAPKEVGGDFSCNSNNLTSLEGAPKEVGGSFSCNSNNLTSLKGAPKEVGGSFSCYSNRLTSLEGAPKEVGGDFYVDSIFTEKEIRKVCNVKGKVILT